MNNFPQHGLYAIINATGKEQHLWLRMAESVLSGGADAIQYRAKGKDLQQMLAGAEQLLQLCRQYGVPCIINDHLQLAADIKADGIHLGGTDADPDKARAVLGQNAIIGVSCYNSLAVATAASDADYVAFGSIYKSSTKPQAVQAEAGLLRRAKQHEVQHKFKGRIRPVVAIGGITLANAAATLQQGADVLAVISDLEQAPDPQQRVIQYKHILATQNI